MKRFFLLPVAVLLALSTGLPYEARALPIAVGKTCGDCGPGVWSRNYGTRTCRIFYCQSTYPFTCSYGPEQEEACYFSVWNHIINERAFSRRLRREHAREHRPAR